MSFSRSWGNGMVSVFLAIHDFLQRGKPFTIDVTEKLSFFIPSPDRGGTVPPSHTPL